MSKFKITIIPVTPFEQNCAMIWDSESLQGAIIDPGGDVPRILQAIADEKVIVETIFITHGHLDHAAGAPELAKHLSVKIIGPDARDEALFAEMPEQAKRFGFKAESFRPDQWLTEGETIAIGGHEFAVLHCPGHTPGHVVFVNHAANFGIFGDVLFRNSVGRTDFPYGSHEQLINAIKTKLMILPDEFAFSCGHGAASTIGAERRSNPFL